MPMNKLRPSKRAGAAIAAIVAASAGGYVTLFPSEKPVHDDVALAIKTLVQPWEGRSLRAYLDTVARPPVPTICDGDTDNVRMGMIETSDGCNKRVATKMERDYRPHLVGCIPGFDQKPLAWRAMMDSLSWNIGWPATCRSTAARLGIAGQYRDSCNAATAFNKAGGRIVIGIVHRREMGDASRIGEGELCVTGSLQ